MENLQLGRVPVAQTAMRIRRPAGEVFEALVNPDITIKFWFTKSSGRLESGKEVRWDWEMYGASTRVKPLAIEPDRRIVIEWDGYDGRTKVEWELTALKDDTTFLRVTESGFTGSGDELVKFATDSTQGFTLMLAGLKAFLEHGLQLNLTADRHVKGLPEHVAA